MDVIEALHDKGKKAVEKRDLIVEGILDKTLFVEEIADLPGMTEKDVGIILEAMEEVSRTEPSLSSIAWLSLAEKYIEADNNTLKREASQVIGNIASQYAERLDSIIPKLLANSNNDGTVIRWGSGYALGRIILIPKVREKRPLRKADVDCRSRTGKWHQESVFVGFEKGNEN